MNKNNKYWLLRGLRSGIPIALGYFAVAFALGITARNAGMSALQSGVMSLCMLASAGEYAAVTLIASGAGILEMIFTTIVVNLRYFLMGCALSQKLDEHIPLIHRFLLSYCITDELFGICIAQEGRLAPVFAYAAACVSAIGWTRKRPLYRRHRDHLHGSELAVYSDSRPVSHLFRFPGDHSHASDRRGCRMDPSHSGRNLTAKEVSNL